MGLHRGGRKKGSYYNEEPNINQKKHIGEWTSKRNLLAYGRVKGLGLLMTPHTIHPHLNILLLHIRGNIYHWRCGWVRD